MILAANLLWAEWISFSASVSLFGVLILYSSSLVPQAVQRIFKYGKAAEVHVVGIKRLHNIEIPKRWFFHFYLFACSFYLLLLWSIHQVYVAKRPTPFAIHVLLDIFVGTHRRATVAAESLLLAMTLMMLQVARRLCECTLLSVYSDAKMNVIHYIFGFSFYFGVGLSLLAESVGFAGRGVVGELSLSSLLSLNHLIGIIVFLASSLIQFKSHVILARLRTDGKGRVFTYRHSIPRGEMFEVISCPHYFAEILIYLSVSLILGGRSATWWMVVCFVVTNQLIVGLFNHKWYLDTFKDYPKARKAVIPFIL